MATIYTVVSSKGGVGKSAIANHMLSSAFSYLGRSFKIFEIDNNNSSNIFSHSAIIKDNTKNVKTSDKNIMAEIIFETLSSDNEIIIDAGGGDDALKVIDIVQGIGESNVKWIIPLNRNLAQLKNASDTFQKINDPKNTLFALNGYSSKETLEEDFIFYFGNKNLNIKSIKDTLKISNELTIPYTSYFEIAEQKGFTLHDLAAISKELDKNAAKSMFYEKFKDDKAAFLRAWGDYRLSENASVVLDEIIENFLPYFAK